MSVPQQYSLRWRNHMKSLLAAFENLLQTELLTDMTLMVEEGQMVQCHKVVLAACSSAFHNILMKNPEATVVVLLGVKYNEIKALLEYMYSGQVQVLQTELDTLLRIAQSLKIKGLAIETDEPMKDDTDILAASPPPTISTSTVNNPAHSSQMSPPHSTGNPYEAYYKSLVDRQGYSPYMPAFPIIPAFPYSTPTTSKPHNYSVDNVGVIALNAKKYPSGNRDTPILRNVLNHEETPTVSFAHVDREQNPVPSSSQRSRSNSSADDSERHANVDGSQGETFSPLYSKYNKLEATERQQVQSTEVRTGGKHGNQKMDWKRYKQYSPQDLRDAINAVKYENMSALKASKIFSVPSRTLYDKIKRLNITTTRSSRRESTSTSSACFPFGIGGNVNGSIYSRRSYSDGDNESVSNASVSNVSVNSDVPPSPSQSRQSPTDWRKPTDEEMLRYDSSPAAHSASSRQHPSDGEDCEMAEDLSINRCETKVKQEKEETSESATDVNK